MTNLDEIEKLARYVSERAFKTEDDIRTCHRLEAFQTMTAIAGENASRAIELARALLLVMPVIHVADATVYGNRNELPMSLRPLWDAIDTMRAALTKETK